MSRLERKLQKRFVVFCEGDTEYNYIDKMRGVKRQDVQITLKPINMHGGGYRNFLKKIKLESQTNCLAKFVIVDADRLVKHYEEKDSFQRKTQRAEEGGQRTSSYPVHVQQYACNDYGHERQCHLLVERGFAQLQGFA